MFKICIDYVLRTAIDFIKEKVSHQKKKRKKKEND